MNSKGYNGNTPLILAANGGHAGIAKLLLKHPHIRIHEVVCLGPDHRVITGLMFIAIVYMYIVLYLYRKVTNLCVRFMYANYMYASQAPVA